MAYASTGRRYARYILDLFSPARDTTLYPAAGTIGLTPIQIPFTLTIDRLMLVWTVAAGNCRMGLYNDNGDLPDGGALVVETGIVPIVAGKTEGAIASTQLQPGLYWLGLQADIAAVLGGATFTRASGSWGALGTLFGRQYLVGAGFGVFANPCPATAVLTTPPNGGVRVASIP